jgi:predicted AAA+ superfamily ATPase
MRVYNTSGPCDPAKHYTVMREALVAEGQKLVDQGRYFTIFSPRQAGKTTWFQFLFRQLQEQRYTPIWISLEGLRTLGKERFYTALDHLLRRELVVEGITADVPITDAFAFQLLFAEPQTKTRQLVLVIDEFEAIPEAVVSEFLHTLRARSITNVNFTRFIR